MKGNQSTKTYKNSEPVRQCPYCDDARPGRGLYNHVNLTDEPNGSHGPAGEVPDNFEVGECPVVGTADVELNRRSDYQQDHNRYVCQYCGTTHKGKSGLGVHLRNNVGDPLHDEPELWEQVENKDIRYTDHSIFPATEDGRILVPATNYINEVNLTNEEEEQDFVIEVDRDLEPVGESIDVVPPETRPEETLSEEDLLEDIRERFKNHVRRGNTRIDPVVAFEEVKESMEMSQPKA